jgi:hypothetical protein
MRKFRTKHLNVAQIMINKSNLKIRVVTRTIFLHVIRK